MHTLREAPIKIGAKIHIFMWKSWFSQIVWTACEYTPITQVVLSRDHLWTLIFIDCLNHSISTITSGLHIFLQLTFINEIEVSRNIVFKVVLRSQREWELLLCWFFSFFGISQFDPPLNYYISLKSITQLWNLDIETPIKTLNLPHLDQIEEFFYWTAVQRAMFLLAPSPSYSLATCPPQAATLIWWWFTVL